jgi:hypothetical protein
MSGLLVDDKGRSWPDDWDLARRIGYADPCTDLSTFTVCERGFIHLRHQHGIARVSVRERRFNLVTFAGALLELGRMDPARIILRVLSDAPPAFYVFTDLYDFAVQAEPMAAGKPLEMRLPRLAEVRNLRVLNLPPFACARPIIDLWRQTRGEFSDDIESALLAGGVRDRMILVRQRPKSERLITEEFGSAFNFLQASDIIGRDIDDQPDLEYGAWMAETYGAALRGRSLRVESCQARIRKSPTTTVSVRYDRVLIPWWAKRGGLFTMCVSIERELPITVSTTKRAAM